MPSQKTPKPYKKANVLSHEDELFIQDAKTAFLDNRNYFAMWMLYTITGFIILFLLWAIFGTIDETTIGEGKVIPASKVKIIQSLDGGTISDIPISEGEFVKKGQVLVKLDDTRYKAEYGEKYKAYLSLLATVSRLKAEAYNETSISFPKELYEKDPELVKMENSLFVTRTQSLAKELGLLKHNASLITDKLKMYEPLIQKGYASKLEYIETERQLDQINIEIAKKENDYNTSVWKELNENKANLDITTEALKELKDKMQDTTILSPVFGVIKKLNITTIGGTISPGMNILEIFPINDSLVIETKIKPKDIAFIKVGQTAMVRISAYDYTIYGDMKGWVDYISADAIEEKDPTNKVTSSYYIVHVRTKKNHLGTEKHKLMVIPGMIATVHIVTGKKSIISYLLKPLIKAKEEALRER